MFYTSGSYAFHMPLCDTHMEAAKYRLRTKAEAHTKIYHLTQQLPVNNTCVWFNGELLHTQYNYFDITVYIQQ